VFHPQAVWFLIQCLVAERDLVGGKPLEQVADSGFAQPREDAFGALGSAERAKQFRRPRLRSAGIVDAQQYGEVVPKRATGARVLTVVLGFRAAARAVVVLRDTRAIDTHRLIAVGSRPAREHALCSAAKAGPVHAHGDGETGPADPAFWPAGAVPASCP
jgi:hypothetical protein